MIQEGNERGFEWTEEYIESLPREDNRFERKSSGIDTWTDDKLREELAKQLSAFANTGGGSLILGADDETGVIDGGLRLIRKGRQTTKEWLEDVIPLATEREIVGFRVIDLLRSTESSHIHPDKAVFIIEIPDSETAPHQSALDRRYYVRLGSKSLPASHRMVEDIRNRAIHPKIALEAARIIHAGFEGRHDDQAFGSLRIALSVNLANRGTVRSQNTCVRFSAPSPIELRSASVGLQLRSGGKLGREVLVEFRDILYPHMELEVQITFGLQARLLSQQHVQPPNFVLLVGESAWHAVSVMAAIYADNAPHFQRQFTLGELDTEYRVAKFIMDYRQRFLKQPGWSSQVADKTGWMGN